MSIPFQFAGALAIAGSTFLGFAQIVPRPTLSDFFVVHEVRAERVGDSAVLEVDRAILRPVDMAYTVRIMAVTDAGLVQVCKAQSPAFRYLPEAVLPDPVTLDWWTNGECPTLPEGPAQIVTTWDPDLPGLAPVTVVSEVK